MIEHDQNDIELAEEIRDLIVRWMEQHKNHCPSLRCTEPIGLLAYLAHCAGIRQTRGGELTRAIAQYETICRNCQHLRN